MNHRGKPFLGVCLEDEQNQSAAGRLKIGYVGRRLENRFLSPLIKACKLGGKHLWYTVQIGRGFLFVFFVFYLGLIE